MKPGACRGFTVVELMVVLTLAATLLAIAVPELGSMVRHQQFKTVVGDLFGAVELTRSVAMARGSRVMLVPADPAGVDWSRGWVVFVDRDGDRRPGDGEEVIASHGALAPGISIRANFSNNKQPEYLAFNSAGRGCSDSSSQAARWGTISVFQGKAARRIKINMLGRARVCDPVRDGADCNGVDAP